MSHFKVHNDGNGWMPMEKRVEGIVQCSRCGSTILWVRTARKRIPFHHDGLGWRDHRGRPCREGWAVRDMAERRAWVTTKWRLSSRLRKALVRDGRRAKPWRSVKAGQGRDESVALTPATQAGGQTTRRAVALGAPPTFLMGTSA